MIAAGKSIVLEDYWELRGEISARGSGNRAPEAVQSVLASIQKQKSYLDSRAFVFFGTPRYQFILALDDTRDSET